MNKSFTITEIDQVKQLNVRLTLKELIKTMFKDLTQFDYDGRDRKQRSTAQECGDNPPSSF